MNVTACGTGSRGGLCAASLRNRSATSRGTCCSGSIWEYVAFELWVVIGTKDDDDDGAERCAVLLTGEPVYLH